MKKKPAPWTAARIVEKEIPKRLAAKPEVVERIGAVVHMDIGGPKGGQWTLDLTRPDGWVSKGLSGDPKLTVRCADQDFVEIATGGRDAQMAVLSGTLVFAPMDLELAGEIGKLFT
ncbi:MAG: SCP2 sterol-binding domain-containing protein [Myxococcaceae bacterium]